MNKQMFEIFIDNFKISDSERAESDNSLYKEMPKEFFSLLDLYGGKTFNKGLYRLHTFRNSVKWSFIIERYFVKYHSRLFPFGFDWMGRQFCMDKESNNCLYMFDPATGETFELIQKLSNLHNDDFVQDLDGMLSSNLFDKVLDSCKITSINYNECIGYKIPLFLGGADIIENYTKSDIEVYWEIQDQLFKQVNSLPDGTKIKSVKIK